ncbi:hypothetical protein [Sphingomonas jatrophae]|uniref:Secreted protein n=1 Tax=Sphingomonas jatrophae TaxID=1166337 RepID=A0A1I6JN67_9SPHN|nr:hypothetical protein [Sphingomonas jatrophae]SFR80361.1 hypothetical protein SAMN05192580_0564 [Sphingomonas jatrophae]
MSCSDWIVRGASLALALAAPAGATASTLVVRSTGPSAKLFPPGKPLADTAQFELKANDSVTLLDAHGTRTLAGPGSFTASSPPNASAPGITSRVAALADAGGVRRARIGAVRGAVPADPAKAPNVWYVDSTHSATVCVADAGTLTLWRPAGAAAELTVSGPKGEAKLPFAEGQTTMAWPANLPVLDGSRYTLAWGGGAAPVSLDFAVVGPRPDALDGVAALLIRRGCQRQLDMLIETVAVPAPSTSTPG